MNKKGQLVAMIAIAIAAVVFLVIVWPKLAVLLKGAGSQSTCNLNLFLAAAVKAGSLGFSEIPAGCEAKYITVGKEDINARKNLAQKRLDKYRQDNTGYYSSVREAFHINQGITDAARDEWALDSIIGNELKDCWNKVWHGKLDIFSRGWTEQRNICIVCSVITFGEDLPASIRDRDITKPVSSLYPWMNAEPYYQTTYYDFIAKDISFKPTQADMTFSTKAPIAVVYLESKYSTLWKALPYIAGVGAFVGVPFAIGLAGVALPAGIIGTVVLNTVSYASGGAVAATVGGLQSLTQEDPNTLKKMEDAAKEGEIKAIGIAPYGGLGAICTDVIA